MGLFLWSFPITTADSGSAVVAVPKYVDIQLKISSIIVFISVSTCWYTYETWEMTVPVWNNSRA